MARQLATLLIIGALSLIGTLSENTGFAGEPGTLGDSIGIGDIDGNDILDQRDVILFARYLAGAYTPETSPQFNMDLNNDGVLSFADVASLSHLVTSYGGSVRTPRLRFTYGDLNLDGVVDIDDAQALGDYLASGTPFEACLAAADINENGKVTVRDLVDLRRKAVGL